MIEDHILDSSIYGDPESHDLYDRNIYNSIYIGCIKSIKNSNEANQLKYEVEFSRNNDVLVIDCYPMYRFAGLDNYEEYNLRPYLEKAEDQKDKPVVYDPLSSKIGDMVVIGLIDGSHDEGVILGTIGHPRRKTSLNLTDLYYESNYNGVKTKIKKDGTWQIIRNGVPTNIKELEGPGDYVPKFDEEFSGTFIGIDVQGSITFTDNDTQTIKIDRQKEKILFQSGSNVFELGNTEIGDKDCFALTTKSIKFKTNKLNIKSSSDINIDSSSNLSLKGQKVEIGNGSVDLIDSLIKFINEIGKVRVMSPSGLCSEIRQSVEWPLKVEPIKLSLKTLKGSIKGADGPTEAKEIVDLFSE